MPARPGILVIDDEVQILRALRTILGQQNYQVSTSGTGGEGLALARTVQPDLIILDLGLPDLDGVQVCRRLREWTQLPVIVLSANDSEVEKVAALDAGADDYLTKPFGINELLARIRVALRHSSLMAGNPRSLVSAGSLAIDLAGQNVTRNGQPVRLTAMEYKLLDFLARNPGRVLTHQTILEHVWGYAEGTTMEYLRIYIRQLRRKLEDDPRDPRVILTEAGIGYRFVT
jgi:two-component system KDP operon response regulator KdpE